MAVINKLRNSKWVLIVILVSLLIFVLTDFFSGNNNISTSPETVGEIDGTGITVQEFETKYREILAQFEANGQAINDESKDQAYMYAWNQFIQANIVEKEYNKLGLDVTLEESSILLYSDNAHPTIKQYFSQDGVFNPSNVINFRNQVAAKDPKSMEQFEMIVKQIVLETKSRKYTSLISKSMFATSLDAEDDFFASSAEANGKSITLNFGNLDDKDFKVTDDELKSYLKKHASEFKQKEGRDFEAKNVSYQISAKESVLKMDLADAYPKEAAIKKWQRSISLVKEKEKIILADDYELSAISDSLQHIFMTVCAVDISTPGKILLTSNSEGQSKEVKPTRLLVTYNPTLWIASTEFPSTEGMEYSSFKTKWNGSKVQRIILTCKKLDLKGKLQFDITKG
jgi:hypothetical protein